jgi:hypothetical protein
MGDALDRVVVVGDDGPFVADAKVDAAAGLGLAGGLGLLADDGLHRDEQPPALLGQRHRQDPRPVLGGQALQPAGVLLGPQAADHRHDEVASVGFKPHRAGGEPDPAVVAMAGLEPGEPDPPARTATSLGVRPVVQGDHQVGDPRRIRLLRGAPPPGRDRIFGLVPRPAKLIEVPRQQRDGRVGRAGVEVGLDLGERPVVGESPTAERLRDPSGLLGAGWLDLEAEAAGNPAVGDGEPLAGAHQRCWPSGSAATG